MSPEANELSPAARIALTRSQLYALVTEGFSEPPVTLAEWQAHGRGLETVIEAATKLPATDSLRNSLAEVRAATPSFAQEADLADLRAAYIELFGHLRAGPCPPYETEYTSQQAFVKNNDLADLMGFYQAFGLELAGGERPDYIGVELEFMHFLALKEAIAQQQEKREAAAVCLDGQKKFLRDHLGRWAGVFAAQLAKLPAGSSFGFYCALGRLLATLVEWDCGHLGATPERIQAWPSQPAPPEPAAACGSDCCAEGELGRSY